MPIHYDTIEDGQNENLIFYSLDLEYWGMMIGADGTWALSLF